MLNFSQSVSAYDAYIGLLLLVTLFIAFVVERRPPVVVALAGGVLMLVLGFIDRTELLAVFGIPAPVTIAAMFVLTGALLRTGSLCVRKLSFALLSPGMGVGCWSKPEGEGLRRKFCERGRVWGGRIG